MLICVRAGADLIRLPCTGRGIKLCRWAAEDRSVRDLLGSRWIETKLGSAGVAPLYGEVRVVNAHNGRWRTASAAGSACVRRTS